MAEPSAKKKPGRSPQFNLPHITFWWPWNTYYRFVCLMLLNSWSVAFFWVPVNLNSVFWMLLQNVPSNCPHCMSPQTCKNREHKSSFSAVYWYSRLITICIPGYSENRCVPRARFCFDVLAGYSSLGSCNIGRYYIHYGWAHSYVKPAILKLFGLKLSSSTLALWNPAPESSLTELLHLRYALSKFLFFSKIWNNPKAQLFCLSFFLSALCFLHPALARYPKKHWPPRSHYPCVCRILLWFENGYDTDPLLL